MDLDFPNFANSKFNNDLSRNKILRNQPKLAKFAKFNCCRK